MLANATSPMISKSAADELIYRYGRFCRFVPGFARPLVHFLYITAACNLDCTYCWQRDQKVVEGFTNSAAAPLTPEEWVRVVENLPRFGLLGISGGEATIAPAFRPILNAAGGRPVTVNTNAVVLRDEDIELLTRGGVRNVSISLDGFAEVHDVGRGRPGLFDKVVANIRRFNEARLAAPRRPKLTIKMVIADEGLMRLTEFHRFCERELMADALNVSIAKAGPHYQFSLWHSPDADRVWRESRSELASYRDRPALARALKALLAESRGSRCPVVFYPRMAGPAEVDALVATEGRNCYAPCSLPRAMVVVLPDGEVIPCQSVALGNVRDHGYQVGSILRGRPYREALRRIEGFGRHLPAACRVCCFAKVRG